MVPTIYEYLLCQRGVITPQQTRILDVPNTDSWQHKMWLYFLHLIFGFALLVTLYIEKDDLLDILVEVYTLNLFHSIICLSWSNPKSVLQDLAR